MFLFLFFILVGDQLRSRIPALKMLNYFTMRPKIIGGGCAGFEPGISAWISPVCLHATNILLTICCTVQCTN